jgi:transposase-like protein
LQKIRFCRQIGIADLLSYSPGLEVSIFGYIVISFKGRHHQQDIILQYVRWYVAYSLSYRDLEELMQERGYSVDHSTVARLVVHYASRIGKAFQKNKNRTGNRWRLDETYIKIKGEWKYLYRSDEKPGQTIDFLLTTERDKKAARCFFLDKAIGSNENPAWLISTKAARIRQASSSTTEMKTSELRFSNVST